jgi:nicotinamidase-related amidase
MQKGTMGDILVKNQEIIPVRILKENCGGLIIDVQERLFPHMFRHQLLLQRLQILIEGLHILDVPVLVTEQYPKGLGPTLEPVKMALHGIPVIEKSAFSCCDEPVFTSEAEKLDRSTWIIGGIETHVCVLQTVMDLVSSEQVPVVVADATSSRNPDDKRVALERMKQEGAIVTTTESILFELARISGTTAFKSISKLVK